MGSRPAANGLADRAGERPDLHLIDAGLDHSEADTAGADHRVGFAQAPHGDEFGARLVVEGAGRLGDHEAFVVGEELVEWRIEEPDGHRQAVHGVDDRREVGLLDHVEFVQDLAFVGRVVAEDQSADQSEPMLGQEHVLGSAQPDAVGAEVTRMRSVLGGVRVGANPDPSRPDQVGPMQERLEFRRRRTRRGDDRTLDHVAGASVDRDLGALGVEGVADADATLDHQYVPGADHRGNAPAASDDGGVARQSATGGEDAASGLHPEHVVGSRLGAHEDDVEPAIGRVDGCLGARDDPPGRRAR